MILYLVRHGETDWNRQGLLQGTTDVPLNAGGRRQARELAAALRAVPFDVAYTSPLRRARETTRIVLRGRRVPLEVLPELRELCYGLWQGRGAPATGRCSPGLEARWRERPWTVRFPGGERLDEVAERATRALERLRRDYAGATVLISGHGHLNRVLLTVAGVYPREHFWTIPQPNACCYRLVPGEPAASTLLHPDPLS